MASPLSLITAGTQVVSYGSGGGSVDIVIAPGSYGVDPQLAMAIGGKSGGSVGAFPHVVQIIVDAIPTDLFPFGAQVGDGGYAETVIYSPGIQSSSFGFPVGTLPAFDGGFTIRFTSPYLTGSDSFDGVVAWALIDSPVDNPATFLRQNFFGGYHSFPEPYRGTDQSLGQIPAISKGAIAAFAAGGATTPDTSPCNWTDRQVAPSIWADVAQINGTFGTASIGLMVTPGLSLIQARPSDGWTSTDESSYVITPFDVSGVVARRRGFAQVIG